MALRVWDIPPSELCAKHLLGEHAEVHAVWSVITKGLRGYSRHPEVLRWRGKLAALYIRHQEIVGEMEERGYSHASPLDKRLAAGRLVQNEFVSTIDEQRRLLLSKGCQCRLSQRGLQCGGHEMESSQDTRGLGYAVGPGGRPEPLSRLRIM